MQNHPDSEVVSPSDPTNQIQQDIGSNSGQAIAQMIGGMAIGQLTVYLSHVQTQLETAQTPANKLGANPYQGLLAFRETDGDRFFGRETQIEQLWQMFRDLHENESAVRVLPIYGPSGSGKSSLALAGLIPKLGASPLPGRNRARLVVLVPGTHPLESLATILARIVTSDLIPVSKTREFAQELTQTNNNGEYDGLRRIADVFPDIAFSPLIVLVDQFEEVYTLCTDQAERDAFVGNLLCATAERSKRVSVILTLRSDFLGETQQHPRLNKLFSEQGFLVPTMQPEELETAIAKPAEQAGHKLDRAIVKLLVEQTQGREALPLLQFALTRIWEGLQNGVDPAETLQRIGGVGGALAGEAQRLYESLNTEDKAIARSIFLALVQLGEGTKNTRRRAALSELIADENEARCVRSIINRFAAPGVRFLATFSDKQHGEMIEVAHEALIRNWGQLQEWLSECQETLRKKRKIEQAAEDWATQGKSKEDFLQGRSLRDAREFMQAQTAYRETALSSLAKEFVRASWTKQRQGIFKLIALFAIFPIIGTLTIVHFSVIGLTESILARQDCTPTPMLKDLLEYMKNSGYKKRFTSIYLCGKNLNGIKLTDAFLENAIFTEAKLNRANFEKSILQRADFTNASLVDANLQKAILLGAKLHNADLESANLQEANLQEANLESANLKNANLKDTNLKNTRGMDEKQIIQALLCRTRLPQNLVRLSNNIENRDCEKLKK
jgi:Pentapeptide repeats (9 copies)/AAA ATPase domain